MYIFVLLSFFTFVYLRDAWHSKLSGLHLSTLHGGKWSKHLIPQCSSVWKETKVTRLSWPCVGRAGLWNGRLQIQARYWKACLAHHLLHIIGSFTEYEHAAGLALFFPPFGLFPMICERGIDPAG